MFIIKYSYLKNLIAVLSIVILTSCEKKSEYYIKHDDVKTELTAVDIEYEKTFKVSNLGEISVNPMVSIFPYVVIVDESEELNLKLFKIQEDTLVLLDQKLKSGKGPGECVSCDRIFSNDQDIVYQYDYYLNRINLFKLNNVSNSLDYLDVYPHYKEISTYDIELFSNNMILSTNRNVDHPFTVTDTLGNIIEKIGSYPKKATEEDTPNTFGQLYYGYVHYSTEKNKIVKAYSRDNRIDIYDVKTQKTTTLEGIYDFEFKYKILNTDYGPNLAEISNYSPYGSKISSDSNYIYCVSEDEFKNQFILKISWDLKSYELYQIDRKYYMYVYYDQKAKELCGLEYDTKNENYRYVYYKI